MRVALLSMLEAAEGGEGALRAGLPVGGRSVARHQLGLALALGCTRVVFVAERLDDELVALQHVAEDAGAQFHMISAPRALVPLVSPADELFVLGDGLLAAPDDARELLEQGPCVLALPVETGLPAGFERIDINHADAGAMRLPGRLVARLGDLPGDWSAQSALLRIAVQAGVPLRMLPAALLDEGRWRLLRGESDAHAMESSWMRLHTASVRSRSPGELAATLLVRAGGPAMLHAGTRPALVAFGAGLVALLGLGAGWFGYATIGFGLLGCSWLTDRTAALLSRIERASQSGGTTYSGLDELFAWLLDGAFVAMCLWRSELPAAGLPKGSAMFAPLVLFGVLRLLPRLMPENIWAHWLADRALAAAVLVIASLFFPFDVALALLGLALLAAGLIWTYLRPSVPNPALTKTG